MDQAKKGSDASAARNTATAAEAPHDDASPLNTASANPKSSVASDASAAGAIVAALANELRYTLTVGQAREFFATHNRKVPAERTLQNYCGEATIDARKIRTTYGSEWLINEPSLKDFINNEPILSTATPAAHAAHDHAAPLNDASASTASSGSSAASDAEVAAVGEKRTLAVILIENAKLLAQVEGKDETISELKEDRNFLREEVRESRKHRGEVTKIAESMLGTLKAMALGRLGVGEPERSEPKRAEVFEDDANPAS